MKKKAVVTLIIMILMLVAPAYATLARVAYIAPNLSFTDTTANCSVTIYDGDTAKIKVVISLKNGDDCIKSWEKSAVGYFYFFDTVSVARGQTYTLSVDATINGKTLPTATVSNICT